MQVNRDQFLEEGYAILREVVPRDELADLRAASELLVDRQKEIWAREAGPEDPPGGEWETSGQPRLMVSWTPEIIDEKTAPYVEFWAHENTYGVSSALLDKPHAGCTEMMMMCSPVYDFGPASWHRDIHPFDTAPLQGYAEDILENGPRYVQWNIPLYDDSVLWVVPGSHVRFNTEEEQAQLKKDRQAPMPGGVQTHLEAGDGVVYITPILHWGSNYSTTLRRTLHGGFGIFTAYEDLGFTECLKAEARDAFGRWEEQSARLQDVTEAALRAVLAGDGAGYLARLGGLQPGIGDKGQWHLSVFLSKAACFINVLRNPDAEEVAPPLRATADRVHPTSLNWGPEFATRFSVDEARELWQWYAPLDAALKTEEHYVTGFQGGPVPYEFNKMPATMDLHSFIAGWSER